MSFESLARRVTEVLRERNEDEANEQEIHGAERSEPAALVNGELAMPISSKIGQLEARIEKLEEIIKSRGNFEF